MLPRDVLSIHYSELGAKISPRRHGNRRRGYARGGLRPEGRSSLMRSPVSRAERRRLIIGGLMLLLGLAALRDFLKLGEAAPWRTMYDFPDFYCAGLALDHHANPYTYEPLHTCERRVNSGGAFRSDFFRGSPAVAIPAPLPPYDFVPYIALARIPVSNAVRIQLFAILFALTLCVAGLGSLKLPLTVVGAVLFLSTACVELNAGQVVPFALLSLVICGVALYRQNDTAAGFFAALCAMEPSVGLPVSIATLLFVPRARSAVIATACALAILAVAVVGWKTLCLYATSVLAAQAASEVHFPYQYSLTYLLAFAGMSSDAARVAGTVSYFVMLVTALAVAPALSRRLARRELLVFFPALCSVVGGAYLHAEELCFAIPAVLLLAYVTQGIQRTVYTLAACLLAVPWILVWGEKQLFVLSIFLCATILLTLQRDIRVTISALAVIATLIYAFELRPPWLPVPAVPAHAYSAHELVQDEWRQYAESRTTSNPLWLAIKVPTWIALLATVGLAAYAPRSRKGIAYYSRL